MDYSDTICECGGILVERCGCSSLYLKCYKCGREEKVQ